MDNVPKWDVEIVLQAEQGGKEAVVQGVPAKVARYQVSTSLRNLVARQQSGKSGKAPSPDCIG